MPSAPLMPVRQPPHRVTARRVTARPAHLCRGRGDRPCRCHVTARRRLARPMRPGAGHALRWRPSPEDLPLPMLVLHIAPQRPQAPPLPV